MSFVPFKKEVELQKTAAQIMSENESVPVMPERPRAWEINEDVGKPAFRMKPIITHLEIATTIEDLFSLSRRLMKENDALHMKCRIFKTFFMFAVGALTFCIFYILSL